ncbi:MAG: hypothetical protein ACE5EB_07800 [Thermodesulfobacteriota bacterium]
MGKNILYVSGGEYGDLYADPLGAALKEILPSATVKCTEGSCRPGVRNPAGGPDKELDSGRVDCLILVDQPSFDIQIIRKARKKGVPVIYYAGAHSGPLKSKQLKKLAGLIDRVLAVFPFEVPLYEEAGIKVEFTGHPLVDIMDSTMSRNDAKAALGYDRTELPVTLISGGNGEEAPGLLRVMLEGAAEAAAVSTRKVRLVIPDAEKYEEGLLNDLIKVSPQRVKVFKGRRQTALRASEAAIVAAGTATVEAALAGAHMLILQKTSALSYFLSGLRGANTFAGLPNIILERQLCPELRQKDVTLMKITQEVAGLAESSTREEFDDGLAEIREKLGPPGTIKRAAAAICGVMGVGG